MTGATRLLKISELLPQFLRVCRSTLDEEKRVYVADKAGKPFITIDPKRRFIKSPMLDVSAQYFKDNFSRCSGMARDGIPFFLTLRGSNKGVYVRRHTAYSDPCDALLQRWREMVVTEALAQKKDQELLEAIMGLHPMVRGQNDELLAKVHALMRGMARMAIGHKPFEEGEVPRRESDSA